MIWLFACLEGATDLEVRLYRGPGYDQDCTVHARFLGERHELVFEPAADHERALLQGDPARFVRLEAQCGRLTWESVVVPDATGRTTVDLRLDRTLERYEPATEGGTRTGIESIWYGVAGAWAVLVILLASRLRPAAPEPEEHEVLPSADG